MLYVKNARLYFIVILPILLLGLLWLSGEALAKSGTEPTAGRGVSYAGQPYTATYTSTLYLPFAARDLVVTNFFGTVTYQGVPVSGIYINLWYCEGDGLPSTVVSTVATNSAGYYVFPNVEPVSETGWYFVTYYNGQYGNDFNLDYLGGWIRNIPNEIGYVLADNFDLATPTLVSPDDGTTSTLPVTFTWEYDYLPYGGSYRFTMSNPYSPANPFFVTVQTEEFSLTSLPPYFFYNNSYPWSVIVQNQDGGYGWMTAELTRHITLEFPEK